MKQNILIVEDQTKLAKSISKYLNTHGYQTHILNEGSGVSDYVKLHEPDLMILDLMLPGVDGLTICRDIRSFSIIPIIMVTAKVEEIDKLLGLEMGADDYISKPFNARVLLARLKAVLRRCDNESVTPPEDEQVVAMTFGDWTLDIYQREIIDQDNMATALSAAEYKLLQVFLQRPQRILSRDQLLDLTHGREAKAYDRSIDNLTSRLRRKIEHDSNAPKIIKTVRGGGYTLAVPVSKILKNA